MDSMINVIKEISSIASQADRSLIYEVPTFRTRQHYLKHGKPIELTIPIRRTERLVR